MDLGKTLRILYFVLLQISFGCLFWLVYFLLPHMQLISHKLMVWVVFISDVAAPNFYISQKLLPNTKEIVLTILQVGTAVIMYNLLNRLPNIIKL